MKNVHEFDGKVLIKTDQQDIDSTIFEEFLKRPCKNNLASQMAHDIIHNSSSKNKDEINHADARALFYHLLKKINGQKPEDKESMYALLEEQLADMQVLGPCAQGRTIRLWQILKCFDS